MKRLKWIGVGLVFGLCGVGFATLGTGFFAPVVNGKGNVIGPEIGAIVYDKSDGRFYGRGHSNNWIEMTNVTGWESFTPSLSGGNVTPTVLAASKRRVGDTMHIRMVLSFSGTGDSSWIYMSIPDSLTYKTTGTESTNWRTLGGSGWFNNGTGNISFTPAYLSSSSKIAFVVIDSSVGTALTGTIATGHTIYSTIEVPIQEWAL